MAGQDKLKADNTPNRAGRPHGSVNKIPALLKEAILMAAEAAHAEGMVGYLTMQAQVNPVAFLSLMGKVLPMQVAHSGQVEVIPKEQREAMFRNLPPEMLMIANDSGVYSEADDA